MRPPGRTRPHRRPEFRPAATGIPAGDCRTWPDKVPGVPRALTHVGLRRNPGRTCRRWAPTAGRRRCARWSPACWRPWLQCGARATLILAGGPKEGNRRAGRCWLDAGQLARRRRSKARRWRLCPTSFRNRRALGETGRAGRGRAVLCEAAGSLARGLARCQRACA
jgi:hypothetical protein